MATNSMIPYSNPQGNNQMTPGAGVAPGASPVVSALPASPLAPTANPLIPTSSPTTSTVPNVGGVIQSPANTTGTSGALSKQETDIYGQGIGGAINDLLEGMSGTDSTILQEYTQSLVPQEATAQANLNASLGAGGVSSNSSVAAIGNANLQAQETAAIAGEEANLTQSQENLTAQILTGQQGAAAKEVAESGWDVFGQVLGDAGSIVGDFLGMPSALPSSQTSSSNSVPTSSAGISPAQAPYGPNSD